MKKKFFLILFSAVLLIGIFFRFYDFSNRWGFGYDQARDVIVAQKALEMHKIPLIGPFTSAAPLVYGPEWFWILMVMIFLFPFALLTPWVIQSALSVGMIAVMVLIGNELKDKKFGLLLGLLTAVSSAHIAQAVNLTSPSMTGITSIIALYFFVKYLKQNTLKNIFLLGFFISLSITIHFQAVGLLFLALIALVFGSKNIKYVGVLILALLIPFIPLIIFDFKSNHFELNNALQYYLHDQYKISFNVLGRNWRNYLLQFWPNAWGRMIGGNYVSGFMMMAILGIFLLINGLRKSIDRTIVAILLAFSLIFLMLRYFRGPLFDSYLAFIHGVIFILSGWVILQVGKYNKYIATFLIAILVFGSIQLTLKDMQHASNTTDRLAQEWQKVLKKKFPHQKFALYDYEHKTRELSLPLSLYLYRTGYIDDKGQKIGIKNNSLINLDNKSHKDLLKDGWIFINPSEVYRTVEEWY